MGQPPDTTRRTRATWTLVIAAFVGLLLVSAEAASGQEAPDTSTTTAPHASTTTRPAPPVTVDLGDGDIGVLPPGAGQPAVPTPEEGEQVPPVGEAPAEGELEVPEELPVIILPDPTPGLNAALADIDVSRARDALVAAEEGRRAAEASAREHFARRAEAIAARRRAGDVVLAAKGVVNQLAVNAVIYGNIAEIEPILDAPSLDHLRDLHLSAAAGDELFRMLEEKRLAFRSAIEVELEASVALVRSTQVARFVRAQYLGVRADLDEAIRNAQEARRQVGPRILAPAVLETADLVAWYRTYYPVDPAMAPIGDIVDAYLRIGEEEGVVGDIAFAQAILETGGFRSGHSQRFNFAGIGAYDHCAPVCAFRFADLDDGVRAHIHLLRAYADPRLTSEQLAATPNPLVAPERVGVRGCCERWTALTGVWATDPNYDRKVLGIYRLMVETARSLDRAQV
ncbi:MAG: glucosaminidase domain-containing protein [Acidimicrobiales bacterium]